MNLFRNCIALLLLLLVCRASAVVYNEQYYYTSPPGSYGGGYCHNEWGYVKFYVPDGSLAGTYYFYVGTTPQNAAGNNWAVITVTGTYPNTHSSNPQSNPVVRASGNAGHTPVASTLFNLYISRPKTPPATGNEDGIQIGTWNTLLNSDLFNQAPGSDQFSQLGDQWYNAQGTPPPSKHPQPLDYTVVNNSKKPVIATLKDPNGTPVATIGVGAGKSVSGSWTPSDSAALGAYTWAYGFANPGNSGTYTYVGGAVSTLAATPGDAQYSAKWDVTPATAPIPAGADGAVPGGGVGSGNGSVTNNTGAPALVQWRDQNGNLVGASQTIGAGGAYEPSTVGLSVPVGTTQKMDLVDVTGGGSRVIGTTYVSNAGDGTGPTMATPIVATLNPPAGAPQTPTTAQTNQGDSQTGVATNGAPRTTAVNNGNSTTLTNQDMYNDVKQAIKDTDTSNSPASQGPTDTVNGREGERTRGHLDDIQGEVDGATAKGDSLRDQMRSLSDFSSWTQGLPTSGIGSVNTVDFGTLTTNGGSTIHMGADLTALNPTIANLRSLLLWCSRVLFVIACAVAVWQSFTH